MNTNTPHIILNSKNVQDRRLTVDYASAETEARRLAKNDPHNTFQIYALVATVTAKVEVSVEMVNSVAVPIVNTASDKPAPTIDLRTCVKGQKLRLRNGGIGQYIECFTNGIFTHKYSTQKDGVHVCRGNGKWRGESENLPLDVTEILPLHYPHLRPVPPELLPLPEGAVYLGETDKDSKPNFLRNGGFLGWATIYEKDKWSGCEKIYGNGVSAHYCAPEDSDIVKLNREAGK